MVIFTQNSNTRGNMPKIYQAHYKDQNKTWRSCNASKTLILAEAKKTAKTFGKEVKVDVEEKIIAAVDEEGAGESAE